MDDFSLTDPDGQDDTPTAPFWMATFSDMMTLLMTFFVMIVAMSEVKQEQFNEALSYFQGRSGVLTQNAVVPTTTPVSSQQTSSRTQQERAQKLLSYLREHDLEDKVQVQQSGEGIRVIISDSVMFRSGEAALIDPSRTMLELLSGMIDASTQAVVVEGHTDDRPIRTGRYPSNWELSSARASSAVRFLLEQPHALPPDRYVAIGYGPHRPVRTERSAGARARNRRVEILLSSTSWQKTPPPPQAKPLMIQ